MPKERTTPAPIKVQAYLTQPEEQAAWRELRAALGSDLDILRAVLRDWYPGWCTQQDTRGAIIGWSEVRTAQQQIECVYCDGPIRPGQQYRAADTVGNVGGVFAHVACEDSD